MDLNLLKSLAQVAAPAGLAIGVFLFIAKDILAKNIFPVLTKQKGYKVIMTLAFMAWTIALFAIVAWVYVESNKTNGTHVSNNKQASKELNLSFFSTECLEKKSVEAKDAWLFPQYIYLGSEYDAALDKRYPLLKLTKQNKILLKDSINWMAAFGNKICKVVIIAGIDEGASREYALGIAQRSAEFIKKELSLLGINPNLIDTYSVGKERVNNVFVQSTKTGLEKNYNNFIAIGIILY